MSTISVPAEELTSYEIGLKSEFLDHTLRINSAAYYDYHDYQALIYTVTLNQLIKNADATHKGIETEIDWAPNPAWRFGLGVAYLNAVVKDVPALCCTSPISCPRSTLSMSGLGSDLR
jgi:iron complex outermembrane receptor protein